MRINKGHILTVIINYGMYLQQQIVRYIVDIIPNISLLITFSKCTTMLKLTRVIFSRSIERRCNDCVGGINYVLHVFISYVYCVSCTCHLCTSVNWS